MVGWSPGSWLAACSLLGIPLPYFVIGTLRPYLPDDALAFIAAAIASLAHRLVSLVFESSLWFTRDYIQLLCCFVFGL